MKKTKRLSYILWPNADRHTPSFRLLYRYFFEDWEIGNQPLFKWQVSRWGRKISFLICFLAELFPFWLACLVLTKTQTFLSQTCGFALLLSLLAYLMVFVVVKPLPHIFYKNGFTEPVPLRSLLFSFKRHYVKYNDIATIRFEGNDDPFDDVTIFADSDPQGFQSLFLAKKVVLGDAYIKTRVLQRVKIMTKNDRMFEFSLNLYEDFYPILKGYFGDNWKTEWYVPKEKNKFHIPKLGKYTGEEGTVSELTVKDGKTEAGGGIDKGFVKIAVLFAIEADQ